MADSKEKLFSDFIAPTRQEWLDKINVDLKGADYQKKMVWRTNEGFSAEPFYRKEDLEGMAQTDALPGEFPYLRGNKKDNNRWYVRQNIRVTDSKEANEKALDLLDKGVTSLGFKVPAKELNATFISTLLEGIKADAVELNFSTCQGHTVELARLLTAYYDEKGYDRTALVGSIDFDPMQKILTKGKDTTALLNKLAELVNILAPFPKMRCICINADTLCNAGAYIYQELGYALAWGNEYLNLMVEAGIPAALAAKKIKFNFGISGVYFMEIAKFRAARMLWANIMAQYKPTRGCASKMKIHAVTSKWNMTVYDPYVNMLRGTTEAMSAAIAGVHSIEVRPFDEAYEKPTDFSTRIARNVQLLLKEESHFNQVCDAAGGSYYIENLTASIAEQAWKLFKEVEDRGGYIAAFEAGFIQDQIEASAATKDKNIATRRETLLGTNQFPNFLEVAGQEVTAETVTPGDKAKCCCSGKPVEGGVRPLRPYRGAMAFEQMRLSVDRSGKEPKAFMLTCGSLAFARARAQFSCNFFACAGIRVQDNTYFKSLEEGVKAALDAKADIVVICAADDDYATLAPEAAKMIGDKAIFVVAGAPACMADLEAQGIKNFIHVKSNVLETLKYYLKELGI